MLPNAPSGSRKKVLISIHFSFQSPRSIIFRTQLFNPGDLGNVKEIQRGYKAQTLSAFFGEPAPPAAPAVA